MRMQMNKVEKNLEREWHDLEANWMLRTKESKVALNFLICFFKKKMFTTNGIILLRKWEMFFEVHMTSLTLGIVGF